MRELLGSLHDAIDGMSIMHEGNGVCLDRAAAAHHRYHTVLRLLRHSGSIWRRIGAG